MKRHHITFLTLLTIGLFLTRCASNDGKTSSDKWYEDTKAEILKQADLKPDSTTLTFYDDSTFKKEHYFSGGHEYLLKGYYKGILSLETYYSNDGNFELRREVCDNGNLGFEGIVYKDHFYGLSTWRYCDGQIDHQGVRHNDKKIGVWKKFDEAGKQIEETDYKNIEQLDSMPTITK
jgi:antitoxin component YwqK of YwqJK toxin-antitoxin module